MLAGLTGLTASGVSFWDVWSPDTSTTLDTVMRVGLAAAATAVSEPTTTVTVAIAIPNGLMSPPMSSRRTVAVNLRQLHGDLCRAATTPPPHWLRVLDAKLG